MAKSNKEKVLMLGSILTIISAAFTLYISDTFFFDDLRLQPFLFDAGLDTMGSMICAALFFGSMKQEGEGSSIFRSLIVLVSVCFAVNAAMYFITGLPEHSGLNLLLCIISKLLDLVLIYLFYRFIRLSLRFQGKLKDWADRGFPVLLVLETLIVLSNFFYPTTFLIDAAGTYRAAGVPWAEDVFLVAASLITVILIIRSESPRNQKAAALTFILLPVAMYFSLQGTFGNAAQYGMVLMSLIIIYCIIFNYNSGKLAATQTELNMAKEIQASMLPTIFPPFPERKEFDLYASMDPAREVGGDFYDFFMVDDDHLCVVIADVSGKGVPAALFMMISKAIVQNCALLDISASEVLRRTNDSLCVQNKMEMFVTAWIGILELSSGKMNCANAGHEYPALFHDGRFELLKDKHGLVLGGMEGVKYRDYEIQLHQGDKIFVYTDGVPEATNATNELFGTDRMIEALNTNVEAPPEEVLRIVRASVDEFVGTAEQFDDLTMLCLQYNGTKEATTTPTEKSIEKRSE